MDIKQYRAAILVISDRSFTGERLDQCAPLMKQILEQHGFLCGTTVIVPDEVEMITKALFDFIAQRYDFVCTTGGTGFAVRDVTPEATSAVIERNAPGIAEAIRSFSMTITPRAMLSRGVAGIREKTLIVNLPGSPKAVTEILGFILEPVRHGLEMLSGEQADCAATSAKKN